MKCERHVHSIAQAAKKAGIAESLLQLWIETDKIKPSIEMSTRNVDFSKYPSAVRNAAKNLLGEDGEMHGWHRFIFSDDDIERLRSFVRRNGQSRARAEAQHIVGSDYSVQELASLWSLSTDTIRELFENESGVLVIGHNESRRKRGYRTLRIPEKVAERVRRRMSNP